jgi:predicted O-methyltransferase YrrM
MPFSFSNSFSNYLRRCLPALFGALMPAAGGIMEAQAQDAYEPQRKRMVEEIAGIARDTGAETGRAVFSERVMAAMAKVPRHEFVPAGQRANAYANRPLPIGQGQTISQPYIVALMTELMDVQPGDRVLEVGTGSGYQAAVLGELAGAVYTVEIVEPLGREAAERLKRLDYRNAHRGWLQGLAGAGAVRLDHGDCRAAPGAASADRSVAAWRKTGSAGRRPVVQPVAAVDREAGRWQGDTAQRAGCPLRAPDEQVGETAVIRAR